MQNPIDLLKKMRRSSDKYCWECPRYPNCSMCERRESLKNHKQKYTIPLELQNCISRICRFSDSDLCWRPSALQITSKDAQALADLGVCTLVKRAEYPGNYLYRLNIEQRDVIRYLRRYRKLRENI